MKKIDLNELETGSAIQLYISEGNINNARYKVCHVGTENGEPYAVLKYFIKSKECFDLKILYGMSWDLSRYYLISSDLNEEEIDDWLTRDKQTLEPFIACSNGATKD